MAFPLYFLIISSFLLGKSVSDIQSASASNTVEINITDGQIIGTTAQTVERNKTYYAFKGIPYAEPPIGNLRFEPPVTKKPWTGKLNCTYDKSQCTQGSNPVTGSEDCLFISVYTLSLTEKLPVMVFIHGGAFVEGNSSEALQSPDHFLNEGVLFVEFQYRLGLFGFMSTEDKVCPGNLGLKDQVVALKWIQKNIARFGGDPKNVTIFGQSAGAVSVSYHMQSKMSKGLFKGAIMDSGTSLCLWSRARNARSTAFSVGNELKISANTSTVLLAELKKIKYDILQAAGASVYAKVTLKNVLAGLAFAPVKEINHEGAFFSENSEETLSSGKYANRVPSILGVNSNECAAAKSLSAILRVYLLKYDTSPTDLAPADLNGETGLSAQLRTVVATTRIKCFYFSCLALSLASEDKICQFVSDDQFNRPVRKTALDLSQHSTTYLYVFSYVGSLGGSLNKTLKGVGHTEELPYFFNRNRANYPKSDILTSKRMVRMWCNFAKYGNPTPRKESLLNNVIWSLTNQKTIPYLNIDKNLTPSSAPFNQSMTFYDAVYKDLGTPPHDTW